MTTDPTPDYGPDVQLKLLSRKMVHSLNNMLFVISGYTQFIKESHMDEETLTNLQQIEKAVTQCQQVTQQWRTEADELVPDPENGRSTL